MAYVDLLRFNSWWTDSKEIIKDKHIQELEAEKIKYFPVFDIENGVYVLRGPRQVGKTTLLKIKIKELIETGTNPKNIFFYSFDLLRKSEDVYSILLEYLDSVAADGKKHIFLDEITTIKEWARSIKLLVDRGDIKKEDAVVVTGSSSIDLKHENERLPGRGIEGHEYYYLPCSFRTYLKLKNFHIEAADPIDSDRFVAAAEHNMAQILKLNKEFFSYLDSGGFLYSINHGKNPLTLERYARWLEGDFVKWGRNPLIVKEIIQALIKKGCSQFSYHSIVRETSVTTHNTIIDYLNMVDEELFAKMVNKIILPFKVERRKEKKIFFVDPLLTSVAEYWADQKMADECKIEHTVLSHVSRISTAYFFNDGKKEIDCVSEINNKILGLEVKWSSNITSSDTYAVKKADIPYVLSKDVLRRDGTVNIIPVSLFLAMFDVGELVRRNVLSIS